MMIIRLFDISGDQKYRTRFTVGYTAVFTAKEKKKSDYSTAKVIELLKYQKQLA